MIKVDSDDRSDPERIGDIVARLFVARGWGRHQERLRLEKAWAEVAAEYRENARVLNLKRGVLEVEVRDTVLMQELSQFHKRRLLGKLQEALKGLKVTNIKFRPGVW